MDGRVLGPVSDQQHPRVALAGLLDGLERRLEERADGVRPVERTELATVELPPVKEADMASVTIKEVCFTCGRRARWLWLGSPYDKPKLVCGLHKRAYLRIVPLHIPQVAPPVGWLGTALDEAATA